MVDVSTIQYSLEMYWKLTGCSGLHESSTYVNDRWKENIEDVL